MQYANGAATNEAIFKSARKLMHQFGYKNTTYQMIADDLSVPTGLVNYHYKKIDFLSRIYIDYIEKILGRIENSVGDQLDNAMQFHIIFSNIMMTQVFADPQTLAFHIEVNEKDLIPTEIHDIVRKQQVETLNHYHINITPDYYYWCATAEYGSRRALLTLNKDLDISSSKFQDFLNLLSTIAVRIAGVSPQIVDDNLVKANDIFHHMEYSDIHMFS
jgi:AcrR family transcriptional regulator